MKVATSEMLYGLNEGDALRIDQEGKRPKSVAVTNAVERRRLAVKIEERP